MRPYVDLCVNPAAHRLAILCEPGADNGTVLTLKGCCQFVYFRFDGLALAWEKQTLV